jgi:hypothetical protein
MEIRLPTVQVSQPIPAANPVDERAHALVCDELASAIARLSREAADASLEAEQLARYGPRGSDPEREGRIAGARVRAREAEAKRDAVQAHLASLEGSDWPAAELVDGITDDVPAGGDASPLAHESPDERRDAA